MTTLDPTVRPGRQEAEARARDAADPLTAMRDRFLLPTAPDGAPAIHLAGQSLGLQPADVQPAGRSTGRPYGRMADRRPAASWLNRSALPAAAG